jgi:hypothetical protein
MQAKSVITPRFHQGVPDRIVGAVHLHTHLHATDVVKKLHNL